MRAFLQYIYHRCRRDDVILDSYKITDLVDDVNRAICIVVAPVPGVEPSCKTLLYDLVTWSLDYMICSPLAIRATADDESRIFA